MDLRFATALSATMSCNAVPEAGDLGITGAKLIVPGAPGQSLVALRPKSAGANRMPPVASSIVDTQGVQVLEAWISALTACP